MITFRTKTACLLGLAVIVACFSCNSKLEEAPKLIEGEFCTLSMAYNEGYLTHGDIKDIANCWNNGLCLPLEEIDRDVEYSIKISYISRMISYRLIQEGQMSVADVYIESYFGSYGDCEAVIVRDNFNLCWEALFEDVEIEDVRFNGLAEGMGWLDIWKKR